MCEFVLAQVPNWEWTRSSENGYAGFIQTVAVDHNGNVYTLVNSSSLSIVFGTDTLNNMGLGDFILVKYTPQGNLLWAKSFGSTQNDVGRNIAIDNNNYVYITGVFSSDSISFDTFNLYNYGMENSFLTKLDDMGNVLWAKSGIGDTLYSNYIYSTSINIDNYGDILLVGEYQGQAVFGADTLQSYTSKGLFVSKFDNAGNVIWARNVGSSTSNVNSSDITSGLNGKVFVVGRFLGPTLQVDTVILQSNGYYDIFIACYDSSGHFQWVRHQDSGGLLNEEVTSIVSDNFNGIYISGFFASSNLAFGNTNLINSYANENDAFLVKFDTLGNTVWAKRAGGVATTLSSGTYIEDIALSNDNALYIAGRFDVPYVSFGGIVLNGFGSGVYSNIFVAKYDTSGHSIWIKGADDCFSRPSIYAISTDLLGNVYVSGNYQGSYLVLGNDTISHVSGFGEDCFVAKLSSNISGVLTSEPSSNLVNIYPNPFNNEFSVISPDQFEVEIILYDVCSKPLYRQMFLKSTTINTSNLSSGIYFYKVISNNATIESGKLIKQ
jgi:hypothetical protein